jgi:hypothetical protein
MSEEMNKDKKYYEKHREEIKLKRKLYYQEQKQAKDLMGEISKKHVLPYMLQSFKNFKETHEIAKWIDYIEGLNKFREMKKVESEDAISGIPLEFDIGHFPLNKTMWQKCLTFRIMICRMKPELFPRDTLFLNEHLLKCESCQKWHFSLKKGLDVFKPFDMWHESEHVEPKQQQQTGIPQDINEWVETEIERLKRDKQNQ